MNTILRFVRIKPEDEVPPQVALLFRHNFTVNFVDNAIWMLGDSFSSAATILPVFVSSLTDSPIIIGLIPAILNAGWVLPQLFMANRSQKASSVFKLARHLAIHERVPYLFFPILVLFIGILQTRLVLLLFFFFLIWRGIASGLVALPWQMVIGRVIPLSHRSRFFGMARFVGQIMGILAAAVAALIFEQLAYPFNYALCFLLTFIILTVSYFFFAMTKDPESYKTTHKEPVSGSIPNAASSYADSAADPTPHTPPSTPSDDASNNTLAAFPSTPADQAATTRTYTASNPAQNLAAAAPASKQIPSDAAATTRAHTASDHAQNLAASAPANPTRAHTASTPAHNPATAATDPDQPPLATAPIHNPAASAPAPDESSPAAPQNNLQAYKDILKQDKNFRNYLISRSSYFIAVMATGFFAVYGIDKFSLSESQAAVFTALLFASGLAGYAIWSVLGDQIGPRRIQLISGLMWIITLLVAIFAPVAWVYYLVFVFFGLASSGFILGDLVLVMELGTEDQLAVYMGLARSLPGIFLLIAPIFAGWFVGVTSYPFMFALSIAFSIVFFIFMLRVKDRPRLR